MNLINNNLWSEIKDGIILKIDEVDLQDVYFNTNTYFCAKSFKVIINGINFELYFDVEILGKTNKTNSFNLASSIYFFKETTDDHYIYFDIDGNTSAYTINEFLRIYLDNHYNNNLFLRYDKLYDMIKLNDIVKLESSNGVIYYTTVMENYLSISPKLYIPNGYDNAVFTTNTWSVKFYKSYYYDNYKSVKDMSTSFKRRYDINGLYVKNQYTIINNFDTFNADYSIGNIVKLKVGDNDNGINSTRIIYAPIINKTNTELYLYVPEIGETNLEEFDMGISQLFVYLKTINNYYFKLDDFFNYPKASNYNPISLNRINTNYIEISLDNYYIINKYNIEVNDKVKLSITNSLEKENIFGTIIKKKSKSDFISVDISSIDTNNFLLGLEGIDTGGNNSLVTDLTFENNVIGEITITALGGVINNSSTYPIDMVVGITGTTNFNGYYTVKVAGTNTVIVLNANSTIFDTSIVSENNLQYATLKNYINAKIISNTEILIYVDINNYISTNFNEYNLLNSEIFFYKPENN